MRSVRQFLGAHPRLAMWLALAVGMEILFLIAARGQGLTAGQLASLAVIVVGVAGLCAWIIGWETE